MGRSVIFHLGVSPRGNLLSSNPFGNSQRVPVPCLYFRKQRELFVPPTSFNLSRRTAPRANPLPILSKSEVLIKSLRHPLVDLRPARSPFPQKRPSILFQVSPGDRRRYLLVLSLRNRLSRSLIVFSLLNFFLSFSSRSPLFCLFNPVGSAKHVFSTTLGGFSTRTPSGASGGCLTSHPYALQPHTSAFLPSGVDYFIPSLSDLGNSHFSCGRPSAVLRSGPPPVSI